LNAKSFINVAKKHNIKIVLNQNGVAYPSWAGKKFDLINNKLRFFFNNADFIIYQSKFCSISANKWLNKSNKKSSIVYNPIDCDKFKNSYKRVYNKKSICKLLVSGSHLDFERLYYPLMTLNRLNDLNFNAELYIFGPIGSNKLSNKLKEHIIKYNLKNKVYLKSSYFQSEAVKIYNEHHILLHLKHNDPSPTVPLEALSCGMPVLAPKSGGMPEIVINNSGKLVKSNSDWYKYPLLDVIEIADSLIEIWKNYNLYSENARTVAFKNFNSKDWLVKHKEIFTKVTQ
jgi:glycosyltransferase involved in cell wall biosynthesis